MRWYALAYIAGILLGWRYCVGLVSNPGSGARGRPTATPLQIDDLVLWITLGVILGGRIGYILLLHAGRPASSAPSCSPDPLEVFESGTAA